MRPMNRTLQQLANKSGAIPGTPVYIGKEAAHKVNIELIQYSVDELVKKQFIARDAEIIFDEKMVSWLNVDGVHDTELLTNIASYIGLHRLELEDIPNTAQRPKFEEEDNYLFFTLKMISYNSERGEVQYEHVSFVVGDKYVVSFQEEPGDVFNGVRERLNHGKGRIRSQSSDYLMYALIDAIVDEYYEVLENIDEKIEELENIVIYNPNQEALQELQRQRRELIMLLKTVFPLREAIGRFEKTDSDIVSEDTLKYVRDVYDHTLHVMESLEIYRDRLSGVMDIYLNSVSNKMNSIMKVLTVMSAIFIPLTFVAGVYGMNFQNMPELQTKYGYVVTLGVMGVILIGMIIYFKKKKWL